MTLHPQSLTPIPEETARVAHAAFPKGSLYLRMRDELGVFFNDADFAYLASTTLPNFLFTLSGRRTFELIVTLGRQLPLGTTRVA